MRKTTVSKLPGITALRAYFKAITLPPNRTAHIKELNSVGGAKYMVLRAQEMLYAYSHTNNPSDLDMAVQLLSTARIMSNGPIELPVRHRPGEKDTTSNHSRP